MIYVYDKIQPFEIIDHQHAHSVQQYNFLYRLFTKRMLLLVTILRYYSCCCWCCCLALAIALMTKYYCISSFIFFFFFYFQFSPFGPVSMYCFRLFWLSFSGTERESNTFRKYCEVSKSMSNFTVLIIKVVFIFIWFYFYYYFVFFSVQFIYQFLWNDDEYGELMLLT